MLRARVNSRFFLIAVLAVLLSSCDKSSNDILKDSSSSFLMETRSSLAVPGKGDFEVTQQMAELFIKSDKDNPAIIDVTPYAVDGVTCFYIFNFEKGFKVISADTRIQPFLAESDEGELYPEKNDNPGIKVWLEDTADRIKMLKTYNPETGEDYSELWSAYRIPESLRDIVGRRQENTRDYEVDSIWVLVYNAYVDSVYFNVNEGPLLDTKWGQGSPWNSKMPKISSLSCVTGCVAVAISQVLYYYYTFVGIPNDFWHSISIQSTSTCPTHGRLLVTLNKSNHTNNSNRWSGMPYDKYGSNTDYVSYLMLDIGERVGMHYDLFSSGVFFASDLSIPNLSSCGISSIFGSYSFAGVRNSLLQSRLVIISGATSSGAGHTWVIDGCKDFSINHVTVKSYYCIHPDELVYYPNNSGVLSYDEMMNLYPDASGGFHQDITVINDHQHSLHMNWGEDGNCDGWYGLLDTDDWIYTTPSGASYNFLYNRVMNHSICTFQLD